MVGNCSGTDLNQVKQGFKLWFNNSLTKPLIFSLSQLRSIISGVKHFLAGAGFCSFHLMLAAKLVLIGWSASIWPEVAMVAAAKRFFAAHIVRLG
ncbi:hypothetical protein L1049_002864 [Liquidambar formosana]|uniref:Uncharacterized protein n=1 Tax=Liquidambar formosana TaxID=63359 RepID=A0AAP0R9E6_LIQFO